MAHEFVANTGERRRPYPPPRERAPASGGEGEGAIEDIAQEVVAPAQPSRNNERRGEVVQRVADDENIWVFEMVAQETGSHDEEARTDRYDRYPFFKVETGDGGNGGGASEYRRTGGEISHVTHAVEGKNREKFAAEMQLDGASHDRAIVPRGRVVWAGGCSDTLVRGPTRPHSFNSDPQKLDF